jgi:AcrR family transcriptional regulator
MPSNRQAPDVKRRIPRQARASETVVLVLEAAAQILEQGGLAAFTTNAVAQRAGVSIGTLYQYFADKNAVLLALAQQEMKRALGDVAQALQGGGDGTMEGRVRAMVRAMVHAFRGRARARKAVMQAILAQGMAIEMMAPLASFIAQQPQALPFALTREQLFVLSRALIGTIRAAVMEEQPFLRSRSFEDEVVRLVVRYVEGLPR